MQKVFIGMSLAAVAVLFSGCALIGTHEKSAENGKHIVVGLFSIDAISDGYPMIPLYSHFDQSK